MIWRPLFTVFLVLVPFAAPRAAAPAPIPVILSTDLGNEIDDQYPLLHLLLSDRFQVLGITAAHAPADAIPGSSATAARLVDAILSDRLALPRRPPVLVGADGPLAAANAPRQTEAARFIVAASRGYTARRPLNLLVIGAATDAASALLLDPTLADRVRIVAMGFRSWEEGGKEFNIENDPVAWRVILDSAVPLVIGDATVTTRDLSVSRAEVVSLTAGGGPLSTWLLRDYDAWYERLIGKLDFTRRPDGTRAWPLWDHVVVAHLLGLTATQNRPRPRMGEDLRFVPTRDGRTVWWITRIDRAALFRDFTRRLNEYVSARPVFDPPCVTVAREPNACIAHAQQTSREDPEGNAPLPGKP